MSISHLLNLHGYFYCSRWRPGGRLLLLLLWKGSLALLLAGRLLAPNTSCHDSTTRLLLLLGGSCRAKDWFALRLVDWGGAWRSAGIWRQIVGVLLELLRVGPCSTLLLLLDLRKHLLLMLGRVHYPSCPTTSTPHLLELVMKGMLRRHPYGLLLLLDSRSRTHSLLWDWSHGLSWGLGSWRLGSNRRWGTGCSGTIVTR